MLFKYDYSFCASEICINTGCKRHRTRTPKGEPYSISDFTNVCEEILVDVKEGEDEQ